MDNSNNENNFIVPSYKKEIYYQCWICRACNKRLRDHIEYQKIIPHRYIKGIITLKR